MNWIRIEGIRPYDGRHEFDLDGRELTTREWGWIKRLSGYMPTTIDQGFDGNDPELFAVFAVIALYRGERVKAREAADVFERIIDTPFEKTITLEGDKDADDQEPADVNPSPPSSNESEPTSGIDGAKSSESLAESRPVIGTPDSDTSPSHRARLAS
jgi:hypothetical protein